MDINSRPSIMEMIAVNKHRYAEAQEEIETNFRLYGMNPQCVNCPLDCKQPNAPRSKIVFCPRMRIA